MTQHKQKFVGRSVPRLEDRPLLLGQGRFAADISFPGQWCMRVVRSSVAHGTIKSIDVTAARKLPGVRAVWTAADVAHIPPIPFRLTGLKRLEPYRQPVLARDIVRYVGEPVAAVFAENAYLAPVVSSPTIGLSGHDRSSMDGAVTGWLSSRGGGVIF